MKIKLTPIVALLLIFAMSDPMSCLGQAGIMFNKELSWQQIKQLAKQENKYIFVDVYATWCGPCKIMDEQVFADSIVGKVFNEKFISVRVQADKTKADSEYTKSWYDIANIINSQYIQVYPTSLFFSPDGDLAFKVSGMRDVNGFLKEANNALDPKYQFKYIQTEFEKRKKSPEQYLKIARLAKDLGYMAVINNKVLPYVQDLKVKDLLNKDNAWLIYEFTRSSKSKGFEFMLNYPELFEKADFRLAKVYIIAKIKEILRNEEIIPRLESNDGKPNFVEMEAALALYGMLGKELVRSEKVNAGNREVFKRKIFNTVFIPFLESGPTIEEIFKKINDANVGFGEQVLMTNTIVSCMRNFKVDSTKALSIILAISKIHDSKYFFCLDAGQLNNRAWFMFCNVSDTLALDQAIIWAKIAVSLDPSNPIINDTYANLLYKAGRKKEAIKEYEKVIALDDRDEFFKKTLKLMKQDKATWPTFINGQEFYPQNDVRL